MRAHGPPLLLFLALVFLGVPRSSAQEREPETQDREPETPEVQKAQEGVKTYLSKLGGPDAQLLWKDESVLAKVFPDHLFFVARYRIYPIAREMPEGLKPSNVFTVGKQGKVQHVKNAVGLQALLRERGVPVKNEQAAKDALAAWLTLTQEFHQDGFYKFEVLKKEFAVEGDEARTVRGRAVVRQGGNGELTATLTFEDGKLTKAVETVKIREGPRPICHATLLLDPNPLVRRIAEQDLLIMGLAARDYLMEQHERASPELQSEIDRVWQTIRRSGW